VKPILAMFLIGLIGITNSFANSTPTGEVVSIQSHKKTISVGENVFTIQIPEAWKSNATKATLVASMPAMGTMPYMESVADITQVNPTSFSASVELTMGGSWELTLTIATSQNKHSRHYSVTTGIEGIIDKNTTGKEVSSSKLALGPERMQRIGVKMASVRKELLSKTVRSAGIVEADTSQNAEVSLRTDAFIQKTHNRRVGEYVAKGALLADIFSPDLVAAQQEFLLGSHLLRNNAQSPAHNRLINLGMTKNDIEKIAATQKPLNYLSIVSPISGTVLEVNARDGARVLPGQTLFVIGNLNRTFVFAKVFQRDVRDLRVGMQAMISIPNDSRSPIKSTIDLISPTSNDPSGLTDVRLRVPHMPANVSSGQYVNVEFSTPPKEALAIPQEAILHSGLHSYVFKEITQGVLEAVEVVAGKRFVDKVEILSGLREGDRFAQSGTFLLSAEANLRSALPKWQSHGYSCQEKGCAP
jgi:Cu(I)/Ag(I) efflux system membrane fusion protein